jgi:hypothetical protein
MSGFMYLEISVHDGKTLAKVVKEGITPRSLGTDTSRNSQQPVAIIAIDDFEGLEVIDTDVLWDELFTRASSKELIRRFQIHLDNQDLIDELRVRMNRKP